MKVGVRKPSVKKSVSARTTGRVNRSIKSAVNPIYGKKGMGMINDPKKAVYNKVYNKTTVSATKGIVNSNAKKSSVNTEELENTDYNTKINMIGYEDSKAKFEENRAYVLKVYPSCIVMTIIFNIISSTILIALSETPGFWGWLVFLTLLYGNFWLIKTYRRYKRCKTFDEFNKCD